MWGVEGSKASLGLVLEKAPEGNRKNLNMAFNMALCWQISDILGTKDCLSKGPGGDMSQV